MKSYVKPSIEVISMRTSENIADNLIKTLYTRNAEGTYTLSDNGTGHSYVASEDITFSNAAIKQG